MPSALPSPVLEGWLCLARPMLALAVLGVAAVLWGIDRHLSRRARQGLSWSGARATEALPVPRRRVPERWGLLLSTTVTLALAVAAVLSGPSHQTSLLGPLLLTASFWAAHLALVARDHRGDPLLLPVCLLLVGCAWIEIERLHPGQAAHQLLGVAVALGVMLAVAIPRRDYRRAEDFKYLVLAAALLLQIAVMLFGTEVNGARLWIRFGDVFQFQPVEIVKVLLIVFLAAYLRQNRAMLSLALVGEERRIAVRYLLPLLGVAVVAELVFVIQRDLGQGLLFFGVFLSMYFAATRRIGIVLIAVLAFLVMSYLCWRTFGHVRVRFDNWLDPWKAPDSEGFQMVQALYAVASGGWFGGGVWRGQPWRVPEASTDFVFVSVVEEMGTVASVALLAAFSLLVARAMRVAREARDDFGAFVACGIGAVLAMQAFVIVGGTIRLIPMTGITLPFMSYGGTSMVVNFLMIGVLLEISAFAPLQGDAAAAAQGDRRGLRPLSIFHVIFLLVPALYLVGFQMQVGAELAASPSNPRNREDLRGRGMIVGRHRQKLAWTDGPAQHAAAPPWLAGGGETVRCFVQGPAFGGLVGYRSARLGEAGLEHELSAALQGRVEPASLWDGVRLAFGRPLRGDNVILTIDENLQREAYAALNGRRGAVVAIDPRNGEILALVSSPGFDSSRLEQDWNAILRSPDAPLVNRALEGLYPPGSVLKPAVVALALDRGVLRVTDTFSCAGALEIHGHRLHDARGEVHGTVDVSGAVVESCNVALAQVAGRLGAAAFTDGLTRFGLGVAAAVGMPCYEGTVPAPSRVPPEMLAQMGFGQGPLTVTPVQVALMTAGLANHGRIMAPHVVAAMEAADGTEKRVPVSVWRTPVSPAAADAVAAMMEEAVRRGTGRAAQVEGVRVAGKTGTAENPQGEPHAWFAGFAPVEAPRVVVVVVVENAGWGGEAAAPLAGHLLDAALRIEARP